MNKKGEIIFFLGALLVGLFSSCYNPRSGNIDQWDLSDTMLDSLQFATTHHYTDNYNFLVMGDSLGLQVQEPFHNQPLPEAPILQWVYKHDRLVVADIVVIPEDSVDSVWVKVARDQHTMGWVHEQMLLEEVAPADSISLFIYVFSNQHLIYFLSLLALLVALYVSRRMRRKRFRIVHFDDVGSAYPMLLCLCFSASAVLYASIQRFVPDLWMEYYYHPTLNPFLLPPVLGAFIASVWLSILLALASVEDVIRQLPWSEAMLYLFSLLGVCAVCYLFFSVTTLYLVGYPCWLLYAAFSLWRYFCYSRCLYCCGKCGAKIRQKGRCPYCGAINE